ncbi:MAG: ABC transporter transmembrane domain-containing protein [Christensenellales bacterium]
MFKLFKYFKKSDWLFTALLIVIVALQVNLDLMLPDLMGDIVGFIQYNALYEEPLREILRTGGLMLLVVAGGFVCKLFSNLIASHITSKLARTLRSKIFKNVNSFSMEEMEKFSTASLITRTTNDVMQIQQTMMMVLKFGTSRLSWQFRRSCVSSTAVWSCRWLRAWL